MHQSPSSATEGALVSLRQVQKHYGGKVAIRLNGIDLQQRERLVIVGGNGSGKSTLLRMLAGITPPSSGQVTMSAAFNKMRIGYVPQVGGLYQNLTVAENVRALAHLTGARIPTDLGKQWYVRDLGLDPFLHVKAGELSGGFQKIAAIACSLAAQPQGLFLDEPFNGIDPERGGKLLEGLKASARLEFLVATDHTAMRFPSHYRVIELPKGGTH